MPRRPRTASLAAKIVALTLGIVAVTVLVSSAIALAGVYTTLRADEAAALVSRRQTVLDVFDGRLDAARDVVRSLTAGLATPSSEPVWTRTLIRTAEANAETFDAFAVVDATGTVLASAPAGREAAPVPAAVVSRGTTSAGEIAFVEERTSGAARGRLWLAAPFNTGEGRRVLAVRMRAGFRQTLVNDLDTEQCAVALLDARDTLIVAGDDGPRLDLAGVRFKPATAARSGETAGLTGAGGPMTGYWASIVSAGDLDWRVVVAEPSSVVMARARGALFPASLMVAAASLGAMFLSTVFARRLVQPLHLFEERARDVASGILVSPLEVDREDEIGRVADAFNAMLVRLNALRELSRLLARTAHLDEVLRGTLAATTRLLGADVLPLVFLLEDGRLRLAGAPSGAGLPAHLSLPIDDGRWPGSALQGEPAFGVAGAQGGRPPAAAFAEAGMRSGLALPLVIAGDPIGVLAAVSRVDRAFSEAETEMLRTFAVQAAMAIANSRLFEEERASRHEAEALRDVAEELEGGPDLPAALDRVAAIAGDLLGAEEVRVLLAPASGVDAGTADEFAEWDARYAEAANGGSGHGAVVAGDGDGDERCCLLVPLMRDGLRRGMLVLASPKGAQGFGERPLSLATTIGREVSLALENAYLLQKARDRANNLERIFRISQAVSSSLQSTVVLNRVLDVVQKIFSADAVSLMTFDPVKRSVVTAMARGLGDRDMLYLQVAPGEDLPGRVFETGRAEVFPALATLDTPLSRMAVASGFRSLLAVPLLARGRSIGVLSVYGARGETFDPQDVELLQTFATQAALAIDTAQLYGKEHRVASVLQASILPETMPGIAGLDVSTVYRPAGEEAEIGGDYYDVFPAPDGRVVLAIADVAGKGVFAATKTSMIRYALRGMIAAGLGPAEALTQLNTMVSESGDPADIVTIWVGLLDIGNRRLTHADAGHPPGLVLQPVSRRIDRLLPTGPVLGGVAGARYGDLETVLEPGATVLLYTDGVTEARQAGTFFGEGRVKRALARGGTAEETAVRLLAAVERFAGAGLRDDAAVLVVRLTDGD